MIASVEPSRSGSNALVFRLVLIWLMLVPLGLFWGSQLHMPGAAALTVLPTVPKAGDPVLATLTLNNHTASDDTSKFDVYTDGRLLMSGSALLTPASSQDVQFARVQPLEVGQQASFHTDVSSRSGNVNETRSLPGFSPLVLTSFVSFASSATMMMAASSTSMLSSSSSTSMSSFSMAYYRSSFDSRTMDAGLIMILTMLALSIFAEATDVAPRYMGPTLARIRLLTARYRIVTYSLYLVAGGIFLTKLAIQFHALPGQ